MLIVPRIFPGSTVKSKLEFLYWHYTRFTEIGNTSLIIHNKAMHTKSSLVTYISTCLGSRGKLTSVIAVSVAFSTSGNKKKTRLAPEVAVALLRIPL